MSLPLKSKKLFVVGAIALAAFASAFYYAQTSHPVIVDGSPTTATGQMIDGVAYIKASEVSKILGKEFKVQNNTFVFGNTEGLGRNLIANPGFEDGNGIETIYDDLVAIPKWNREIGQIQIAKYDSSGFSILEEQRPPNAGKNYFAGAKFDGVNTITQTISFDAIHKDAITSGAKYTFTGYLGGYSDHTDPITLTIEWLNPNNESLGVVRIDPVKVAERGSETGFIKRTKTGDVPAKATSVRIKLSTALNEGEWQDCYADNLSLTFSR